MRSGERAERWFGNRARAVTATVVVMIGLFAYDAWGNYRDDQARHEITKELQEWADDAIQTVAFDVLGARMMTIGGRILSRCPGGPRFALAGLETCSGLGVLSLEDVARIERDITSTFGDFFLLNMSDEVILNPSVELRYVTPRCDVVVSAWGFLSEDNRGNHVNVGYSPGWASEPDIEVESISYEQAYNAWIVVKAAAWGCPSD